MLFVACEFAVTEAFGTREVLPEDIPQKTQEVCHGGTSRSRPEYPSDGR
jgi:hypothetical protein